MVNNERIERFQTCGPSARLKQQQYADEELGLVRFVPRSDPSCVLIGQPIQDNIDVGAALRKGEDVKVEVFSGSSALAPEALTGRKETIGRILSPLAQNEVGTIRCIGLNVRSDPPAFPLSMLALTFSM